MIWGKKSAGRDSSKCKGHAAGASLAGGGTARRPICTEQSEQGRGRNEVTEIRKCLITSGCVNFGWEFG